MNSEASENKEIIREACQETATVLVASVGAYIDLIENIDQQISSDNGDYHAVIQMVSDLGKITSQTNVASFGLLKNFEQNLGKDFVPPRSIFFILGLISSSCFLIKDASSFEELGKIPLANPNLIMEILEKPLIEKWLETVFKSEN